MQNTISRPPSPFPQLGITDIALHASQTRSEHRVSPRQALDNLGEWASQSASGENRIEALNRISHAHQQRLLEIDLSGLGLNSFPPHLNVLVPQLTVLKLSANKLNDLQGMPPLELLQELWLDKNEIQSLQGMVGSNTLRALALDDNQLHTLVSLPGLPALQTLKLQNNQLESLAGMPRLNNLNGLFVSGNHLRDVQPLSALTGLNRLHLANNRIADLAGLRELNQLVELFVNGNPLNNLQGLPTSLTVLDASTCHLSNLSGVEHLTLLSDLRVSGNELTHLNELISCTHLNRLDAFENPIEDFNVIQTLNINNLRLDSSTPQVNSASNEQVPLEGILSGLSDLIRRVWSQGDFHSVNHLVAPGSDLSPEQNQAEIDFANNFSERLFSSLNEYTGSHDVAEEFYHSLLNNSAFDILGNQLFNERRPEFNSAEITQLESILLGIISPNTPVTPAIWALQRWGSGLNISADYAENFLNATVSSNMREKLSGEGTGGETLLRLCAGQVYSASSQSEGQLNQVYQRLKDNMAYLEQNAHNEELMREVIDVADDAVNRCGDRVSYGETRLHHVLETHRMMNEALRPSQIMNKLESSFLQMALEDLAARISRERGSGTDEESVELYFSLVAQIKKADPRIPLQELATDSLFGHLHKATESEVQEGLNLFRNKNNPAKKAWLLEHPATEKLLKETFSTSHARMLMHREILSDAGYDLMSGVPLSQPVEKIKAAYRYAYDSVAPDISQMNGTELLSKSGEIGQAWKEKRLDEILINKSLLN